MVKNISGLPLPSTPYAHPSNRDVQGLLPPPATSDRPHCDEIAPMEAASEQLPVAYVAEYKLN